MVRSEKVPGRPRWRRPVIGGAAAMVLSPARTDRLPQGDPGPVRPRLDRRPACLDSVQLVSHDRRAGVGFQYAAQYPDEVARYVQPDYPLPGLG